MGAVLDKGVQTGYIIREGYEVPQLRAVHRVQLSEGDTSSLVRPPNNSGAAGKSLHR